LYRLVDNPLFFYAVSKMREQIEADWENFKATRHQPFGDPTAQPFQPTIALSFAERLAESKDEDEAITCMQSHPEAAQSFYVAAHFALPYLLSQTNAVARTDRIRSVPYVALAAGLVSFLQRLESQYGQTTGADSE